jgi:hypothetical protein
VLVYSLELFRGILPDEHYAYWELFVEACRLTELPSLTTTEITRIKDAWLAHNVSYIALYGHHNFLSKHHELSHEDARVETGPSHVTHCFMVTSADPTTLSPPLYSFSFATLSFAFSLSLSLLSLSSLALSLFLFHSLAPALALTLSSLCVSLFSSHSVSLFSLSPHSFSCLGCRPPLFRLIRAYRHSCGYITLCPTSPDGDAEWDRSKCE